MELGIRIYTAPNPQHKVYGQTHIRRTNRINQIGGFIFRCYRFGFSIWLRR